MTKQLQKRPSGQSGSDPSRTAGCGAKCRKLETAGNVTGLCDGTVFARLPSEQELCPGSLGQAPVTVCLSRDIRIEISAGCPAGLVSALLCALKSHA